MPCFLAGVSAATAFCAAKGIPLVQTTHRQGHISAALFAASGADLFGKEELVFHVSGGTTDLLRCKGPDSITCIGTSGGLCAWPGWWTAWRVASWAARSQQDVYVSTAGGSLHREHQTKESACAARPAAFRLAVPVPREAAGS
ncbi:MAG: hypothetical protein ACLT8A_13735 [Subdoligranulum sp.]